MRIRKYLTVLLCIFSVIPLVFIMILSVAYFGNNSLDFLQTNVKFTAQTTADNINQFFSQRKIALSIASDFTDVKYLLLLSNMGDNSPQQSIERDKVIDNFQTITSKKSVETQRDSADHYVRRFTLVNKKGLIIASDEPQLIGKQSNIKGAARSDQDSDIYVSSIMQDPDFISGQKYFDITVPIFQGNDYQGSIQSSIDLEYFDMIRKQIFMNTGSTVVFDQSGNIVQDAPKDDTGNPVSNIKKIKFDDDFYNQEWKKIDLKKNPSGLLNYKMNGIQRYGYYSTISGTDWMIVSTVSEAELLNPFMMIIKIYVGVLLIFSALLIFSSSEVSKQFLNPIKDMGSAFINVEQRDYSVRLPVNYKGEFAGMASSFNHLIEKIQADTDELKVNEARYELIMAETNQVIFEWDIQTNHMYHTVHWTNKFGFSMSVDNPGSQLPNIVPVYQKDKPILTKFFKEALNGGQPKPVDVRMKTIDSQYIWCTVSIKVIYDENHKPYRAIGLISDTDHQKKIMQSLESKSRMDLLTQLYNKVTTELLIEEYLQNSPPNEHHGFVIVDIDNFKGINDTLGHIYGDAVLKKVALSIKNLFRLSDIVGRVGGDEFVILVKELPRDEHLKIKLKDVCDVFHDAYTGENEEYKISASVGAAFYPNDGMTFTELYRHADIALYRSKRAGKDQYSLYEEQTVKITS